MSNMLREAIVDAKALRESALKNAESVVIEKYSDEVRKTLEHILEQDDLDLDMGGELAPEELGADLEEPALDPMDTGVDMADPIDGAPAEDIEVVENEDDIPFGATDGLSNADGKNLDGFADSGEGVEVTIDLGALQEALKELKDGEEIEVNLGEATAAAPGMAGDEAVEDDADDDDAAAATAAGAAATEADSDAMKNAGLEEGAGSAIAALPPKEVPGSHWDMKIPDEGKAVAEYEVTKKKLMKASDEELDAAVADAKRTPWKERSPAQRAATAAKYMRDNPGGIPRGTDYDSEKEKPQRYKGSGDRMRSRLEEDDVTADALVDAVMEKLTVDMGAELSGWAGRPTSQLKHEQERELAGAQSDDVKEELKDLNKAQEEMVAENNQLKEKLDQYKQATYELKESLQDVNLSNARLLYTNRVLRNTSLNERQKDKIVEAISGAGSVTEARTIFDTLQSTVESTPKRGPQSLGEAINRNRTSVIRATRKESAASDPFQDRMKKLAGIK
jgi:hypothetical protein